MEEVVPVEILAMVKYNLTKYQILLLKKFTASLGSSSIFKKKHPDKNDLSWKALFVHPEFTEDKKKYAKKLLETRSKCEQLHKQCRYYLEEIKERNEFFEGSYAD